MSVLYDWIYSLITSCSSIWEWLITPLFSVGDLIDVAPISLLVGGSLVIGVVRAIL